MKPTLKIALIGEGKNDVGVAGEFDWKEGTVQAYLRRFLGEDYLLEFTPLAVSKEETRNEKGLKGGRYRKYQVRGVAKELWRFVNKYGKNSDFDLLIFFSDSDKTTGMRASEKEALKKYKDVVSNIETGENLITDVMPDIKFIPMIPLRILECWLLGDAVGFQTLDCQTQNTLPQKAEFVWGDKYDPNSNYPKNYLKRVLDNCNLSNDTETLCALVENQDFENLSQTCPVSFRPFFVEMVNLDLS
ncbi:MAG: hypothetical protein ACI85O_002212 [Saprospiraceae bacterium]|jgi:hypothetical protein